MGTPTGRAVIAAAGGCSADDVARRACVVNVALRTIGDDLDASLEQLQWINNGYLVVAGRADPSRRLARGAGWGAGR